MGNVEDSKTQRVMAKPPEPPPGLKANILKDIPKPLPRPGFFALFRHPEKKHQKEEAKRREQEYRENQKRQKEEENRRKKQLKEQEIFQKEQAGKKDLDLKEQLQRQKIESEKQKLELKEQLRRQQEGERKQQLEQKLREIGEKQEHIKKEQEVKERLSFLSKEVDNLHAQKEQHQHEVNNLLKLKDTILKEIEENKEKLKSFKNKGVETQLISAFERTGADENLLSRKEQEILQKIERNQKLLDNKEQEVITKLEDKRRMLLEKENSIHEQIKLLSNEKYEWDKRRGKLEKEIENLTIRKNNLEREIQERTAPIDTKEQELVIKEKRIREDELELNKKEDEIISRVDELKRVEINIKDKEDEIEKDVKRLDENKDVLLTEEKKVLDRLKILKERESKIQENFELIKQSKKVLEQAFWKKFNSFMILKNEWDKKEQLLKDVLAYIEGQKKGVPQWMKEIDHNVKLINQKEDEITITVQQIEEDKQLLDGKEKEIIDRIEQLKQKEHMLSTKEDDLKKREIVVENAKSLVGNLPKFTEQLNQLKVQIAEEQEKLKKTTDEAVAKWTFVKDKEREVQEQLKHLEQGQKIIKEEEERLAKEKEGFETQEFDTYLKTRLEEPEMEIFKTKNLPKEHYDVYALIDHGKQLIRTGSLFEAEKIISRVKEYYEKLKETDKHKKRLNYELLEMITDIKLASLSQ